MSTVQKTKLYSDFTGKFQMDIPIDWEYKNPSLYRKTEPGAPQAFGFYDGSLGAFQISCKLVTPHIQKLIQTRREPVQSSDSANLNFSEQLIHSDGRDVYAFSCAVDDHYFFATYIVEPDKELNDKIQAELVAVRNVLSSIKFIKEPFRKIVVAERRFDLFMVSIASIVELKNKAVERDSFIEYIVYTANHIDALLRLSIILTNQLAQGNNEIDVTLLFQSENDKPIMEKAIYKRCLDMGILNSSLYDRLKVLYDERNKVIHRFIITDIRVEEIFGTATAYENIFDDVESIIENLEAHQRQRKVGVWGNSPSGLSEETKELLITKIKDKQGRLPKKRQAN